MSKQIRYTLYDSCLDIPTSPYYKSRSEHNHVAQVCCSCIVKANNTSGRSGSTNSPIPKFSAPVSFQSQLFEGKLCYLTMILHSHTPPPRTGNPDSVEPRQSPSSPGSALGLLYSQVQEVKESALWILPLRKTSGGSRSGEA